MKFIDPPDGRPWALLGLASASLLANLVMGVALFGAEDAPVPTVTSSEAPPSEPVAAPAVAAREEPVEEPSDTDALRPPDLLVVKSEVQHSLARTFQVAHPEHADVLSAVYARLFVWDLDLRRDLQRGDRLAVGYTWDGELAHIPVASYTSGKLGETLRAYQFQADGDRWPSWWTEDGTEVPRRLVNGPLGDDYEQITSLLKDRPKHKGMDFKVPEGTPVVSPRPGTVVRADWNLAYNGNCAEVRFDDGTLARFLHLSETQVSAGQRLPAGARVGLSGNTGRSTAPHLHYELERNGQVVDPVGYHGVTRRQLPEGEMDAFRAAVRQYDRVLADDT